MTLVYNGDSTTKVILNASAGTKKGIDICASSTSPSIMAGLEQVKQASMEMAMQGVRIRFLTGITRENIPHCKETMKISEVRHLGNIKGGMAVSEKECISASTIFAGRPVPQILYSNVGDFVEQERYLFDTLWIIARPGRHRITEIEQGRQPEFMELITDPSKASKTFATIIQSVEKRSREKRVEVRIICLLEGADGKRVSTVDSKIKLSSGHESGHEPAGSGRRQVHCGLRARAGQPVQRIHLPPEQPSGSQCPLAAGKQGKSQHGIGQCTSLSSPGEHIW